MAKNTNLDPRPADEGQRTSHELMGEFVYPIAGLVGLAAYIVGQFLQ